MASPASQTLLEMTQEILESMQSDEVDSITDTSESKAVAHIIRRTYWDLFGIEDLPEHYSVFQLDETSASTPVLMTIPENVFKVDWIKYNKVLDGETDPVWVDIPSIAFDTFVDRSTKLPVSSDDVETFTYSFSGDSIPVYYQNFVSPSYFSTPDDFTLLFNSYDSSVETYLHANKTMAYGLVDPTFTFSDSFRPDLDVRQYALLVNEAKSMAFAELKQTQHAKADQRARKLLISSQRTKYRVGSPSAYDMLPDYGRRTR